MSNALSMQSIVASRTRAALTLGAGDVSRGGGDRQAALAISADTYHLMVPVIDVLHAAAAYRAYMNVTTIVWLVVFSWGHKWGGKYVQMAQHYRFCSRSADRCKSDATFRSGRAFVLMRSFASSVVDRASTV